MPISFLGVAVIGPYCSTLIAVSCKVAARAVARVVAGAWVFQESTCHPHSAPMNVCHSTCLLHWTVALVSQLLAGNGWTRARAERRSARDARDDDPGQPAVVECVGRRRTTDQINQGIMLRSVA